MNCPHIIISQLHGVFTSCTISYPLTRPPVFQLQISFLCFPINTTWCLLVFFQQTDRNTVGPPESVFTTSSIASMCCWEITDLTELCFWYRSNKGFPIMTYFCFPSWHAAAENGRTCKCWHFVSRTSCEPWAAKELICNLRPLRFFFLSGTRLTWDACTQQCGSMRSSLRSPRRQNFFYSTCQDHPRIVWAMKTVSYFTHTARPFSLVPACTA